MIFLIFLSYIYISIVCIFVCSCIYVLALVPIHHHHHHHHLPQPHQQVSFKKKSIVVVSPWFTFSFPLPWVWGPPWIQEHCKVSFDKFLICFNPISWSPGTCGRALVLERIVGGQNAELGQYPWLVNLGYTRKAGNWKWIIFFKPQLAAQSALTSIPRSLTTLKPQKTTISRRPTNQSSIAGEPSLVPGFF